LKQFLVLSFLSGGSPFQAHQNYQPPSQKIVGSNNLLSFGGLFFRGRPWPRFFFSRLSPVFFFTTPPDLFLVALTGVSPRSVRRTPSFLFLGTPRCFDFFSHSPWEHDRWHFLLLALFLQIGFSPPFSDPCVLTHQKALFFFGISFFFLEGTTSFLSLPPPPNFVECPVTLPSSFGVSLEEFRAVIQVFFFCLFHPPNLSLPAILFPHLPPPFVPPLLCRRVFKNPPPPWKRVFTFRFCICVWVFGTFGDTPPQI